MKQFLLPKTNYFDTILRPLFSNAGIFLAFVVLTIMMTWPWVQSLRDYAPDAGDSYLNAWILWWDYHQTLHDPLRLFDANILYPYQYTLAFSEHNYGIAFLFFPLYALGFRPLTVHGIAILTGFAFSGYGAFRLTRTLTGSRGAAWVAGVAFAFVPFRFHHLPHVTYLFSGWMPLLLEALVLYTRRPNGKRAAWLGIVFFLNALACIHWFLLTLIPLGTTALLLASRYSLWKVRRFWLYGSAALVLAALALLPFLVPYLWVRKLYGLTRTAEEARLLSAHLFNWLIVDWQNKFWPGLGSSVFEYRTELALFPGFLPPLLSVAAFRLLPQRAATRRFDYQRILIGVLDGIIVGGVIIALLCIGYGSLQPKVLGIQLFHLANARAPLIVSSLGVVVRIILAVIGHFRGGKSIKFSFRRPGWLSESLEIGLVWIFFGFIGSLGMNFFFHRLLFEYVPLFQSIRVPARWAMICFVGLALLAGAGAAQMVRRLAGRSHLAIRMSMFLVVIIVMMCEQRSAPLNLIHGAVDPDPATRRLRDTPMRGGVIELPAGAEQSNYLYTLRAADHARPLVDGISGFRPPIEQAVEEMSNSQPVPDKFGDLLEAIPVSFVVVHHGSLSPESDRALQAFFDKGVAAGRFRIVAQFSDSQRADDLYVVTRTESVNPIP
jgi:hypothetical protein